MIRGLRPPILTESIMGSPRILDKGWLRYTFILPKGAMNDEDKKRRSTARGYHKFSDTTLGGNQAINPLPQFSRFTDIKEKRIFDSADGSSPIDEHNKTGGGMGRWYSENIEDNAVYLHVRAGVPMNNSLTGYFSTFYNSSAASLARTGRTDSFFYTVGYIAGGVVSWAFAPFILGSGAIDLLTGRKKTKYYYLRPSMPAYLNAVQNIVNTIMVNKGMLVGQQPGIEPNQVDAAEIAGINNMLPDIFTQNGQFDVYAVLGRYQRRANKLYSLLSKAREEAENLADFEKQKTGIFTNGNFLNLTDRTVSLEQYISDYLKRDTSQMSRQQTVKLTQPVEGTGDGGAPEAAVEPKDLGVWENLVENISSYFSEETFEALVAEWNDGCQFITYRVDNPGSVGESFSNSAKESQIASSLNSISKNTTDMRFNFANGNLTDGWIGATIGGAMKAATSLVSGAADALQISGISALFGNALLDIPKYWDSSSVSFPTMTYNFQLRQTYGNDLSAVQNLWVPVASLLALALPLSTGPASYTQPFLCEVYCEGRAQSKLCLVESLSLTRGVGPKGWTPDNRPTAIDVSITFLDLNSVMHMPITSGYSMLKGALTPGGIVNLLSADEGAFQDYLATISGLGLVDQIYPLRKLKRQWHTGMANMASWTSPYHLANWVGGWGASRVLSGIFAATNRG